MKILYLCTHQIHNLTPLFRKISKNKKINFKVLYWQRILAHYHDPEFDKVINFGIDQFSDYKRLYLSKHICFNPLQNKRQKDNNERYFLQLRRKKNYL